MGRVVEIPLPAVVPEEAAVLRALGVPADAPPGQRVRAVLVEALGELRDRAEPRGIVAEIDAQAFAEIFEGAGDNERPSPLEGIFPRAEHLTLFAVTIGEPVGERIAGLFGEGRFALGATLDAAASEATELAASHVDRIVLKEAREHGAADAGGRVLHYSPGYCGWSITGQRALFAALAPDEIGIRLTESCLMEPLKSISGVMVVGPAKIHDFENDYGFCSDCRTQSCRARIKRINTEESKGDEDGNPGEDRR
jgi:hypothetical protein